MSATSGSRALHPQPRAGSTTCCRTCSYTTLVRTSDIGHRTSDIGHFGSLGELVDRERVERVVVTATCTRKSSLPETTNAPIVSGDCDAEKSGREGGRVFGSGSRASVATSLLVNNPDRASTGTIHYRDIGDYLARDDKLALLAQYKGIEGVAWEQLTPNKHGDWINQRNDTFATFASIGDKSSPSGSIFGVLPSRTVCTLFEMTTCVCKCGSPARLS
jgi:hypothetical protein